MIDEFIGWNNYATINCDEGKIVEEQRNLKLILNKKVTDPFDLNQEPEKSYFKLKETSTILDLKKEIQKKFQHKKLESLVISFEEKVLENTFTFEEYKIKSGSHLDLTVTEENEDEF